MRLIALAKEVGEEDTVIDRNAVIEKTRALCRAHRDILDMSPGFIERRQTCIEACDVYTSSRCCMSSEPAVGVS